MHIAARLSLRSRLLALALLPLVGMSVFAGMWASERFHHADEARAEREVTDVAMGISDIIFALQTDERVASLDGTLNGPLAFVAGAVGRQARGVAEGRRGQLDRHADVVDRLTGRPGAWRAESRRLRRALARRGPVASSDGGMSLVSRLNLGMFGDITPLISKVAGRSTLDGRPSPGLQGNAAAVRSLKRLLGAMGRSHEGHHVAVLTRHSAELHHAATQEIFAVLARLSAGRWDGAAGTLMPLKAAQDGDIDVIRAVLPPEHRRLLRLLTSGRDNARWRTTIEAVRRRAVGDRSAALPSKEALPAALIARLTQVSRFQEELGRALRADAEAEERAERRRARTALAIALGIVIATLALAGILAAAVRRPLRSLEQRARRLSTGDLGATEGDGARRRGRVPPEVAVLSDAFDDLAANLRVIQAQADALAAGDADAAVLRAAAPGPLGEALRRSVKTLSAVSAQLRASEALSRAIVTTAAEAIWTVDAAGRITSANPAAAELLGRHDVVGLPVREVLGEDVAGAAGTPVATLANDEVWLPTAGGERLPALVSSSRAGGDDVWTVFARDISVLKEYERRLAHQAFHDPLTGLANRALLLDRLEAALGRPARDGAPPVALLIVDLDDFKSVNDRLGHAAGDDLLVGVAERLQRCLRPGDLAARLGGDEFAVLLEDVDDPARAEAVARRILELLSLPVRAGDRDLAVGASVGIRIADAGSTPAGLLHDADVAMYAVKDAGKGGMRTYGRSAHCG